MDFFGIRRVGVTPEKGRRLLLAVGLIVLLVLLRYRQRAEQIIREATRRHALGSDSIGEEQLQRMRERYGLEIADLEPTVYYRLTSNWVQLAVRFLVPEHGIRDIEDAISLDILSASRTRTSRSHPPPMKSWGCRCCDSRG